MAARVGALAVSLIAKTLKFNKQMKDSAKRVERFAAVSRKAARNVGLLGAASVAAAGFGLLRLTKASFKSIDSLAKTSDKLGIQTEALAKMQLAAKLTGVETNTLTMALQRMTRRVSEAALGTGEAQAALKELRIDAEKLNKLTPDRQFERIAEAFKKVSRQSDKVRLAFKLFDSEGVSLINTLNLGKEGLHAAGIEAESLGLALSRFDAAKIEQTNDSVKKLKLSFEGIGNKLAIGLSPSIEAIAGIMTEQVKGANDWASAIVDGAESGAIAVAALKDIVDKVGRAFLNIRFAHAKLGTFKFLDIARNNLLPPDQQLTPQEMENFRNENQDRADALLRRMIDNVPTSSVDSVRKTFAEIRNRAKATAAKQAGTGESGLAIKGFVLPSVLRAVQAAADRAALLAPGRISGLGPGFGRQTILPRDLGRERADFARGIIARPRHPRGPVVPPRSPSFSQSETGVFQPGGGTAPIGSSRRAETELIKQTDWLRQIANQLKNGTTATYAR